MDSRLTFYQGQRPAPLRTTDLPSVALAIVAALRKLIKVDRGTCGTMSLVHLHGRGLDLVMRGEDWAKILPYLRDGTFNPQIILPERIPVLQPEHLIEVAMLDQVDRDLYQRVLGVLLELFPESYPVSNL